MSLPIQDFIKTKIEEYDSDFDMREGTPFTELFIKPLTIIVQPFRDELDQIEQNQSILNVLESDDPDAFPEDAVDALLSNVFVERKLGDYVNGVVRAYFLEPRSLDTVAGGARFLDASGNVFLNTGDITISSRQMTLQVSGNYYYIDIPVQAEEQGAVTVEENDIVSWENAPSGLVQVGNENPFTPGADRETNTEFITRAKDSISVRDLVAEKGIIATLNENFGNIEDVQSIGMGDPEMQRDIVYNTHIGGHVDIYVKTPLLQTGSYDVTALVTDSTRKKEYHSYKKLTGEDIVNFGIVSIDRSNYSPIVKKIENDAKGIFISTVNLSGGIDLSTLYNIKISVTTSGITQVEQIGIQGAIPSVTTRGEIIQKINNAFGFNIAFEENGLGGEEYIRFETINVGVEESVVFQAPTGLDATNLVLGLSEAIYPHIYQGSTAQIYEEGADYLIDDSEGSIQRIATGDIEDNQLVDVQFEYNPISIDIGKPVRQPDGTYTVRDGRDDVTITDLAFINVTSIEVIDPVSGEPTDEILDAIGGFGQGLFGRGVFGIGAGSDYRLIVVRPEHRYSEYEESYIEISPNYIGMDLRVNYRYAPEISDIQSFIVQEGERIVSATLVAKHFIPAFVDFSVSYDLPASNVSALSNQELTDLMSEAINDLGRGKTLEASDIVEFLYRNGATKVDLPITMKMTIHNTDGTKSIYISNDSLSVPNPILESQTDKPVSSRIVHYLPGNITLTRRTV